MPLSNIFIYSQMFSTFLIGVTLTCLGFCYYDEWESAFLALFFFLIIKILFFYGFSLHFLIVIWVQVSDYLSYNNSKSAIFFNALQMSLWCTVSFHFLAFPRCWRWIASDWKNSGNISKRLILALLHKTSNLKKKKSIYFLGCASS